MADYEKVMDKLDYLDDTKGLIKDAIIEKGQDISEDVAFREYVEKIKEISSGDVKLFNTYQEMQEYSKAKDGDLALVYNTDFVDLYSNVSFSAVCIPKVITLGSVVTQSKVFFANNDEDNYMQVYISQFNADNITDSYLRIDLNSNKQSVILNYLADETGLTYTFNNGTINNTSSIEFDTDTLIFDFEEVISERTTFDDLFVSVFKVRKVDLQGLYKYTINNKDADRFYAFSNIQYNNTDDLFTFDKVHIINVSELTNKMFSINSSIDHIRGLCKIYDVEDNMPKSLDIINTATSIVYYNNKFYNFLYSASTQEKVQIYINNNNFKVKHYDLENNVYTEQDENITIVEVQGSSESTYYALGTEITAEDILLPIMCDRDKIRPYEIEFVLPKSDNGQPACHAYPQDNYYFDGWIRALTQYTAEDNSYIVTDKTAYGKNGNIKGDGTYLKHVTTKEFRNFFAPQLPEQYSVTEPTAVLQYGEQVPYYTYVKKDERMCSDVVDVDKNSCVVAFGKSLSSITVEDETYNKVIKCKYSNTFYVEINNKLYAGMFGYNKTTTGSTANAYETISELYGVLIDTASGEVYRTVNHTTPFTPFRGWGNSKSQPNADIKSVYYDDKQDEFIIIVTTGTWAWSNTDAPFLALYKINGTSGDMTEKRYKVGRHGETDTHVNILDVRYDITTKSIIAPIDRVVSGASYNPRKIAKIDSNDNITLWINKNDCVIEFMGVFSDDGGYYIKQPLYCYRYYDENKTYRYMLKRIDTDAEIELQTVYSYYAISRVMLNNYVYYFTRVNQNENKLTLRRVNITTMKDEKYGELNSLDSRFIRVDNTLMILSGSKLYSLDDLQNPAYLYYDSRAHYYNNEYIDGLSLKDGYICNLYPKVNWFSSTVNIQTYKQLIYEYSKVDSFPIKGDLYMAYPYISDDNTMGKLYMNQSICLSTKDYDGTITPFDYQQALNTAKKIEGKTY